MNLGGFMGALGDAFVGYGHDQDAQRQEARQTLLDQQNAELHHAQVENYNSEAALRNSRAKQEAIMHSRDFEDLYVAARAGDSTADAKVRAIVAGHPNEAQILAPLNQRDQNEYDPMRGQIIDKQTGVARSVTGLGPRAVSAEERAAEGLRLREAAAQRSAAQAAVSATRGNLDEVRKEIPQPGKMPIMDREKIVQDDEGHSTRVPSIAYLHAVGDSTRYMRDQVGPARAAYTKAVDQLSMLTGDGSGGSAPAAPVAARDTSSTPASWKPPRTPPFPDDIAKSAQYLMQHSYTRAQVRQQLQAWNFNVIDSGAQQ